MCHHPQCNIHCLEVCISRVPVLFNLYKFPLLNAVSELEPIAYDFRTGTYCSWSFSVLLNYLFVASMLRINIRPMHESF